jgi:hypothetical protein
LKGRSSSFLEDIFTVGAFLLAGVSVYLIRSADPDLWWHIKAGEIIVATGDVPRYDIFSFTAPHAPWIDHEWGAHVIFYYLYSHFGDAGLTAFKTMLGLGAAVLIFLLARSSHHKTRLLVFLLTSQVIGCYARYRPQMISYFFVALLLWFLSREKIGTKVPPAVSISLLFFVWANLHGGFLAGLALLGAYAVIPLAFALLQRQLRGDEWARARRLAFALLTSTLVTLANPYGLGLWQGLAHELAVNSINHQYVREWAPVLFTSLGMQGLLLIFIAVLTTVAFALRPGLWRGEEIVLVVGTFGLAVYSIRNIPFFAIVSTAPLARSLGSYMSVSHLNTRAQRWFKAAFAATLAPALIAVPMVLRRPGLSIETAFENMGGDPSRAIAFMAVNQAYGNLYNPLGWGGYLIWHHSPGTRISVDGRSSTVYPRNVLEENYRFYSNEATPDLPLKTGADFVLIEASNPVVPSMNADDRWVVVYRDKDAILLAGPSDRGKQLVQLLKDGQLIVPKPMPKGVFP